MQSGMIFRRYYLFLVLKWIRWREKRKMRMVLKPFGLCITCYSAWISMIVSLYFGHGLMKSMLGIGITYITIRTWKLSEEVAKMVAGDVR